MTARTLAAAALALALAGAGCVSETTASGRSSFDSSADAAGRGGWGSERGGERSAAPPSESGAEGGAGTPSFVGVEARDPSEYVRVPVENVAPVEEFFDREGFLLGERIEIDCSFEPFMARMVALAATTSAGKYVVRTDVREGGLHVVTLRSTVGGTHQQGLVPRVSFAPQKEVPRDPVTGDVRVRPVFEFVAAQEIVVRLHLRPDPDRPVWLRARASGTPQRIGDTVVPVATYMNPTSRRRARGEALALALEVRRSGDGWETRIQEPADGGGAGAR